MLKLGIASVVVAVSSISIGLIGGPSLPVSVRSVLALAVIISANCLGAAITFKKDRDK